MPPKKSSYSSTAGAVAVPKLSSLGTIPMKISKAAVPSVGSGTSVGATPKKIVKDLPSWSSTSSRTSNTGRNTMKQKNINTVTKLSSTIKTKNQNQIQNQIQNQNQQKLSKVQDQVQTPQNNPFTPPEERLKQVAEPKAKAKAKASSKYSGKAKSNTDSDSSVSRSSKSSTISKYQQKKAAAQQQQQGSTVTSSNSRAKQAGQTSTTTLQTIPETSTLTAPGNNDDNKSNSISVTPKSVKPKSATVASKAGSRVKKGQKNDSTKAQGPGPQQQNLNHSNSNDNDMFSRAFVIEESVKQPAAQEFFQPTFGEVETVQEIQTENGTNQDSKIQIQKEVVQENQKESKSYMDNQAQSGLSSSSSSSEEQPSSSSSKTVQQTSDSNPNVNDSNNLNDIQEGDWVKILPNLKKHRLANMRAALVVTVQKPSDINEQGNQQRRLSSIKQIRNKTQLVVLIPNELAIYHPDQFLGLPKYKAETIMLKDCMRTDPDYEVFLKIRGQLDRDGELIESDNEEDEDEEDTDNEEENYNNRKEDLNNDFNLKLNKNDDEIESEKLVSQMILEEAAQVEMEEQLQVSMVQDSSESSDRDGQATESIQMLKRLDIQNKNDGNVPGSPVQQQSSSSSRTNVNSNIPVLLSPQNLPPRTPPPDGGKHNTNIPGTPDPAAPKSTGFESPTAAPFSRHLGVLSVSARSKSKQYSRLERSVQKSVRSAKKLGLTPQYLQRSGLVKVGSSVKKSSWRHAVRKNDRNIKNGAAVVGSQDNAMSNENLNSDNLNGTSNDNNQNDNSVNMDNLNDSMIQYPESVPTPLKKLRDNETDSSPSLGVLDDNSRLSLGDSRCGGPGLQNSSSSEDQQMIQIQNDTRRISLTGDRQGANRSLNDLQSNQQQDNIANNDVNKGHSQPRSDSDRSKSPHHSRITSKRSFKQSRNLTSGRSRASPLSMPISDREGQELRKRLNFNDFGSDDDEKDVAVQDDGLMEVDGPSDKNDVVNDLRKPKSSSQPNSKSVKSQSQSTIILNQNNLKSKLSEQSAVKQTKLNFSLNLNTITEGVDDIVNDHENQNQMIHLSETPSFGDKVQQSHDSETVFGAEEIQKESDSPEIQIQVQTDTNNVSDNHNDMIVDKDTSDSHDNIINTSLNNDQITIQIPDIDNTSFFDKSTINITSNNNLNQSAVASSESSDDDAGLPSPIKPQCQQQNQQQICESDISFGIDDVNDFEAIILDEDGGEVIRKSDKNKNIQQGGTVTSESKIESLSSNVDQDSTVANNNYNIEEPASKKTKTIQVDTDSQPTKDVTSTAQDSQETTFMDEFDINIVTQTDSDDNLNLSNFKPSDVVNTGLFTSTAKSEDLIALKKKLDNQVMESYAESRAKQQLLADQNDKKGPGKIGNKDSSGGDSELEEDNDCTNEQKTDLGIKLEPGENQNQAKDLKESQSILKPANSEVVSRRVIGNQANENRSNRNSNYFGNQSHINKYPKNQYSNITTQRSYLNRYPSAEINLYQHWSYQQLYNNNINMIHNNQMNQNTASGTSSSSSSSSSSNSENLMYSISNEASEAKAFKKEQKMANLMNYHSFKPNSAAGEKGENLKENCDIIVSKDSLKDYYLKWFNKSNGNGNAQNLENERSESLSSESIPQVQNNEQQQPITGDAKQTNIKSSSNKSQ